MPWRSARTVRPAIVHRRHVEELQLRRRPAEQLLDHLHRVRALHLEPVGPAAAVAAQRTPLVELDLHVEPARLGVVGDPVERRGAADEVEPVLGEMEEDHVADHVAVGRARDEVLGLVDGEALEAVDGQPGEQLERVRALHREVGHVVRLVVEHAGLLPGRLLVPPVRELGRDPRVDVRAGLRVAQQLHRALDRGEQVFKASVTHDCPPSFDPRIAVLCSPR